MSVGCSFDPEEFSICLYGEWHATKGAFSSTDLRHHWWSFGVAMSNEISGKTFWCLGSCFKGGILENEADLV